jgi:regulator of replication initiation timing
MSELAHEAPEAPGIEQAVADLSEALNEPIRTSDLQLVGTTVADMKQAVAAMRELLAENERLRRETETLRQELDGARAAVVAQAKRRGFW